MKRYVYPGQVIEVELPYSEVCCHLRVAGQMRAVHVLSEGAQILTEDEESPFSMPITHGETGIFGDAGGLFIKE